MAVVTATEHLVKQSGEVRRYEMKFNALMSTGETFASVSVVTATRERGCGIDDLNVYDVGTDGQSILMWVSGGQHLSVYRVNVKVTTSTGQTLVGDGILEIRDR